MGIQVQILVENAPFSQTAIKLTSLQVAFDEKVGKNRNLAIKSRISKVFCAPSDCTFSLKSKPTWLKCVCDSF